jgi:hypothetical protein
MHSPALALNWQIWGRHRWGLAGALLVLAIVCAMPQAYPSARLTSDVSGTGAPLVMAIVMPFAFVMLYLAYVFSHAELGNGARSSGFPLWMLTLPVRTPWLVVWPMLSAAVTVALSWLAVAWFALNKVGLEVPLVWPALGLASSLVWIQAIDWSPLGFMTKALVAGAVLAGLWTGLLHGDTHNATFAALPGVLLLGFVAGVTGVSRLRRGASIGFTIARLPGLPWRISREQRFATARQAQFWLEWRRNGSLLPLVAACWVLLVGLFMVLSGDGNVKTMMGATPYLLLILAPVAGLLLGKPDVWSRQVGLPTFAAARPLTCGDMVLIKLRMAALSLAAAWLVLAVGLAIWLATGTHYADLRHTLEQIPQEQRSAKLYVELAAAVLGFFGFNLLFMAGTFVVSFTGRFWLLLATLFLYLGGIPNLIAMDAPSVFKEYRLELATAALVIKLLLAGWAFRHGYRRGLISGAGIAGLLGTWLATVGCTFLAFCLVHPENGRNITYLHQVRDYALGIALFCPLARIALAPLALAWNRHR